MLSETTLYESKLFGCLVGIFTGGLFAFMESGEYASNLDILDISLSLGMPT
jgi:hypothetical protein